MCAVPLQCPHMHPSYVACNLWCPNANFMPFVCCAWVYAQLHIAHNALNSAGRAVVRGLPACRDSADGLSLCMQPAPLGCSALLRRFPYVKCLADNMHSLDHKADECASGQKWEAAEISGCANGAWVLAVARVVWAVQGLWAAGLQVGVAAHALAAMLARHMQ